MPDSNKLIDLIDW